MFSWDSEVDFEIWVLGLVKIVFEKLIASAYEGHTEIGGKILSLGCVNRLWASGRLAQPKKSLLADLCIWGINSNQT